MHPPPPSHGARPDDAATAQLEDAPGRQAGERRGLA